MLPLFQVFRRGLIVLFGVEHTYQYHESLSDTSEDKRRTKNVTSNYS